MYDKIKVFIIESERGWGQRVDEELYFDTRALAEAFCTKYNTEHCPPRNNVPDWYMYARIANR